MTKEVDLMLLNKGMWLWSSLQHNGFLCSQKTQWDCD